MAVVTIPIKATIEGKDTVLNFSADLDKLGNTAKKTQSSMSGMTSVMQGMAQGFGQRVFDSLTSSVSAIPGAMVSATSAMVSYGSSLVDIQAQTGRAIEAQQELAVAAMASGVGASLNRTSPPPLT